MENHQNILGIVPYSLHKNDFHSASFCQFENGPRDVTCAHGLTFCCVAVGDMALGGVVGVMSRSQMLVEGAHLLTGLLVSVVVLVTRSVRLFII